MYIGCHSMKQMVCALPWSMHTIKKTVAVIMYTWWSIHVRSSIQMHPTSVFSHLKGSVSLSYKRRLMYFWSNPSLTTSWMTTISVGWTYASISAVTIRKSSARLFVCCESCPRRQSTSACLVKKRTKRRRTSTTSITSSFNAVPIASSFMTRPTRQPNKVCESIIRIYPRVLCDLRYSISVLCCVGWKRSWVQMTRVNCYGT